MDRTVPVVEQGHVAAGVTPGQILLGKYRIERVLGTGGMGVVVAATHITLEERVAIKFLLPHALTNPEAVARFLREARAAVRIKSEHVARVTDVGELENGAPYMIMEYLDGTDLATLAQRRGALPIEEVVEYVLQACEAIAEAHALGIVHRDLKPANLFVVMRPDGTPSVKVLDFGISKLTGMNGSGTDLGMTKTTTVMGSPLYMSPEQMASSRDVDARTDIWALGAILYELLTGTVPFQADTITQLCAMILQQPAPPLRNLRPDAPERLEHAVFCCLEKDRNRRFATVADLAQALGPFAPSRARLSIERVSRVIEGAGLGGSQRNLEAALPPSSPAGTGTAAAWGASGVPKAPSGRKLALVAGLVVLAAGAGAALFSVRKHDEVPAAAAAEHAAVTAAAEHAAVAATGTGPDLAPVGPAPEPTAALVTPAPSATASGAPSARASSAAPEHTASPRSPARHRPVKTSPEPAPTHAAAAPSPPAPPAPKPPAPKPPAPKPVNPASLYEDRK